MKLLRLEIKRFGRYEDQAIDFAPGLNIIFGNNESGKTTLAEALCTVLFDDPARPSASSNRYSNWSSEHPYLLHLDYQSDGRTYSLTRDVSTELSLLQEVETGNRWNSFKEVQEQILKALGYSEREFFEATSFMRQANLGQVGRHADLIKDKLERLLNTNKDEVLASRLLERLNLRIRELEGRDSHDGEINEILKKASDWDAELQTCKTKTAELLEARKRVHSSATELQECQAKFDEKHERFKKSKMAFEAAQSLEKERESHVELARRTREAQEIKTLTGSKKETLKSLTKIERVDVKTCEGLATQRVIFEGKVEDYEKRLERERETVEQAIPREWYKYMLGVGLVAIIGCLIAYFITKDSLFLGATGTAAIVVVTSVVLWFSAKRDFSMAQSKFQETKTQLEEERDMLRKNVETLDALLRRFKAKDVDELAEKYELYRDLDRDIKTMVARYEIILGENNLKDLEVELAKMSERMDEQSRIFEQHRAFAVSGLDLERLQREVSDLDKRLSRLTEESTLLNHKLEFLESGTDVMAPLQERIDDAIRKADLLRAEAEQLKIVSRYLEESRRKVLKSSIEMLEEEASSLLLALTAGTWSKLRLDRQHLTCEISRDGQTWHKPEQTLSVSARDSLYIALRLALVRILSGDRKPPFVMDDPFINLDRIRRVEAERVLRELAVDYQIVFLSADQHYREVADHLVDLSGVPQHQSVPASA